MSEKGVVLTEAERELAESIIRSNLQNARLCGTLPKTIAFLKEHCPNFFAIYREMKHDTP